MSVNVLLQLQLTQNMSDLILETVERIPVMYVVNSSPNFGQKLFHK